MRGAAAFPPAGFPALANALPNQLCILDRQGRVAFINRAWSRFASDNGYCGGAFLGVDYLRVCEEADGAEQEDARAVGRGLRDVLDGRREVFEYLYPCHAPDCTRSFRLQASPLDDGLVLQHVPAADPVRAERALMDILAHLAHELRTPLSAISGYSELLQIKAEAASAEERGAYTAAIRQSSAHLAGVIDDMLDMARSGADTSKIRLNDEVCDLHAILDSASDMVAPMAEQRSITLALRPSHDDGAGPSVGVLGDRRRLTQVLVNLLTNAIKFSPAGSTVRCQLSVNRSGGLRVEITDSGPGMSADEIPLALSPYGRTASARDTGAVGLGLGLPLSQALMELHGGSLSLDSARGRGTTAAIHLPAWRCGFPAERAGDEGRSATFPT